MERLYTSLIQEAHDRVTVDTPLLCQSRHRYKLCSDKMRVPLVSISSEGTLFCVCHIFFLCVRVNHLDSLRFHIAPRLFLKEHLSRLS